MDDDQLAFFIIFAAIMLAIVIAVNAIDGAVEEEPVPDVLVLSSPDLTYKQVMNTPFTIQGVLSRESSPTFVCYVYNNDKKNVSIEIVWWLNYGMNRSYVSANFNASFVLAANQTEEILMSFSLRPESPSYIMDNFERAGSKLIVFDIKTEYV